MSITRRKFLSTGAAIAATGPHLAGIPLPRGQTNQGRPKNVLLLMADQHKPDALGIAGDPVAETPNLDAFARTGIRFSHAYCTDPVCVPSRPSLLTGLYPHNIAKDHYSSLADYWPYNVKTIAHYFSRAGYMTSLVGKMHFLDAQTHGFDYKLDFNDWYQYLGPKTKLRAEETFYPDSGEGLPQIVDLWRESGDPWMGVVERDNREGIADVGRISALAEEDHFENFVSRESIRFLRKFGKQQPFFLISSFLKPHAPFMPAERFGRIFHPQDVKLPDTWGKVNLETVPQFIRKSIEYNRVIPETRYPEKAKVRIAMYYACLAQTDDNVGRILQVLQELDLDKDTIVLYTADHGEMLGEHGLWQKFVFYEASVGVPLIFRVPGTTSPDTRCETPVSLVQILASLAELCGVSIPSNVDGASLVINLREPQRTFNNKIFAEHNLRSKGAGYMIRHGNYKYSYYVNDIAELYNLETDPKEIKNLALLPEYKEKAEEMKQELFAWHVPEELKSSG